MSPIRVPLRRRFLALFVVASVVAAACTSGSQNAAVDEDSTDDTTTSTTESTDTATSETTGTTEPEPEPSPPAEGTLQWSPCDGEASALECATLEVPLDYQERDGQKLDIAVARLVSKGPAADRIGSLVFNPGGPGGSGIEILQFLALTMSDEIQERFDLVSFDPRGVGASTALECETDIDDKIELLENDDDAGWQQFIADTEAQFDTCTADTLALAPYVGTNNAARDMDMLRAALGDEGLSYVGYSYGTRLGATYAELFPDNVRALVLDGAVKPSDDSNLLNLEQGAGFDRALKNFADACDADPDCVLQELGPTLEVIESLEQEIAEVGSFDTDDPDRVLTPGELSLGIAAALYSKETWPILASALFTAEATQDGTLLQVLGDSLVGRQPDGTYDNSNVANVFINCADDPNRPSLDEQRALSDQSADQSLYFDEFLRASAGCYDVPISADPIRIGPASGSAPLLVIGNSGDPATPFEWSEEMADQLDTATLYTVEAEGHTAYGSIDCVQADVDAYLIDLVVPEDGASCSDEGSTDFFLPEGESELDQVIAFFDCLRDEGLDLPAITEGDLLIDPELEGLLGDIDFSSADSQTAVLACADLIPAG